MQLLSVNVSLPQTILYRGEAVSTGIYKTPVDGAIMLRQLNLDGDGQADLRAHGGPYKAVYAYPYEHYAYWQLELNREPFTYGQFGENFTIQGLTEDTVHIGDVLRIGEAIVQITQPRVPCFKLEHKMGLPGFIKQFLHSERSGFYMRVQQEGLVKAGDTIELVSRDPVGVTVKAVNRALYIDKRDVETARRALEVEALPPGWRDSFTRILAAEGNDS